jgi:ubiquinone/menaquinone biosynthesis C-methylase UbiE
MYTDSPTDIWQQWQQQQQQWQQQWQPWGMQFPNSQPGLAAGACAQAPGLLPDQWLHLVALGLWSWNQHVFKPAQLLRNAGLYQPVSIGRPPPAGEFRGGEPVLSRSYREPQWLDQQPDNYSSVAVFDQYAEAYEEIAYPFTQTVFEEMLTLMQPYMGPNARILDPSAGPAREARLLAKMWPDAEVVAADLARGMVEVAWQKARSQGISNMAFFQSDVADPRAEFAGYFDAIHCSIAFHHYPDGRAAARAFRSVLAPGGKAFIADAGPDWFKLLSYGWSRLTDPGFVQHRNGQEFQQLFLEAGFADVYWIEALPGIGFTIAST